MFTGISAFPLTPLAHDVVDEHSFIKLTQRLVSAGVDSITALGSTGSYAYLTAAERARVIRLAVEHAEGTPVFAGVGALRTSQVLAHVEAAQQAGAQGLLLAPVSYQPLTDEEVYQLFSAVAVNASVPLIVYDNPGTTRFTFTSDLYGRIAELPAVASIKIPPVPDDLDLAQQRIQEVRAAVPEHVTIGVSGDPTAVTGLVAGADAWYSVIGGTLPEPAMRMVHAVIQGNTTQALGEAQRLSPLWDLFSEYGSLRVTAALAEHLELAPRNCLPLPLQGLGTTERERVATVLSNLG